MREVAGARCSAGAGGQAICPSVPVHPQRKKQTLEPGRLQGVIGQAEQMGVATAIRAAEPRHRPGCTGSETLGYGAFEPFRGADREDRADLGNGPEPVDMPVKALPSADVPLHPRRQVYHRRPRIEVEAFPEKDTAQPAEIEEAVFCKGEDQDVAPPVVGLPLDIGPGDIEERRVVRQGEIVPPFHCNGDDAHRRPGGQ